MPPLVIPSALQARIIWSQPTHMDHPPQNVFGIGVDTVVFGTLNAAKVAQMAGFFDTAFTTSAIAPSIPSTCDPVLLVVTDIRTSNGPQFAAALTANSTGTADPLPGEVALVSTLRTQFRGRSFRGRWYWPSFVESVNDITGRPTLAIQTACNTLLQTFDTNLLTQSGNGGLSVLSRLLLQSNRVTGITTNNSWDSQRRRGFR